MMDERGKPRAIR